MIATPEMSMLVFATSPCPGVRPTVSVDSEKLFDFAVQHRVLSLAFERARECFPSGTEETVHEIARRNLLRASELIVITRELTRAGIASTAWKGPALAMQAYGGLARREFADLDILVDRAHALAAWHVLLQLGFRPTSALADRPDLLLRWETEATFHHRELPVEVDLHWALSGRFFPVQFGTPLTETVDLLGQQLNAPSREQHLLFLAVHGAKHGWARLQWITDVAWLFGQELDRTALWEQAAQLRAERFLALALKLAEEVYGIEPAIPSHCPEIGTAAIANSPLRLVAQLAAGRASRWRYLAGLALNPTEAEWTTVRLPSGLTWAYYPLRMWRLARKYNARDRTRAGE